MIARGGPDDGKASGLRSTKLPAPPTRSRPAQPAPRRLISPSVGSERQETHESDCHPPSHVLSLLAPPFIVIGCGGRESTLAFIGAMALMLACLLMVGMIRNQQRLIETWSAVTAGRGAFSRSLTLQRRPTMKWVLCNGVTESSPGRRGRVKAEYVFTNDRRARLDLHPGHRDQRRRGDRRDV